MPTTVSGLWGQIIDFNNLYQAYLEARKGKRNRASVLRFSANVEENIVNLQNHLIWKSWAPGTPREFVVKEPKLRLIQAPPFVDRVIHHALVRVIGPLFERKFIYDSYACRIGKGTQAAVFRAQRFIRIAKRNHGEKVYVLKADISKLFASIKHNVLLGEIKRTISDPNVIWLWQKIIEGYGHEDGVGLPVGALTSQLGANIMLDRLDHVAKDQMGIKHYVRYMDDFIAVLPDKESAVKVMDELGLEVGRLSLALNPKTAIHPWQRGLDFCGYRIWPTHILPRKRNIKRARKNFKVLARKYAKRAIDQIHVRQRVCSFLAYTKHCDANRTVAAILGDLRLVRCPEKLAG